MPPPSRQWSAQVVDAEIGPLRLTGKLSEPDGAAALVIVVHGLAGCCDSPYVVEAALRLWESGIASLRLNLRGADRLGEDIYHGGLTADLVAAFSCPEVAAYEKTAVMGFSLGGHVAIRYVVDHPAPELRAAVAICPPLDLAAAAETIDAGDRWLYRRYLLARLVDIYSRVAARRKVAKSVAEVKQARTFVAFDGLVIAPRYGFADAWDYYRTVSVGPDLHRLSIPTLIVAAKGDPMVPAESLMVPMRQAPSQLECHWSKQGGHLAFPSDLDLGMSAPPGLYPQVLGWLGERLAV